MSIATSKQMFINMSPSDIPEYDRKKHYYDQELSTIDFYAEEHKKIREGVTINGYHVSGFLYNHLNHFKSEIPVINPETGKSQQKIIKPTFRDNEFLVDQFLHDCWIENKLLALFGTRRFAKSTIMASHMDHKIKTNLEGTIEVVSGAASDLKHLAKNLKTAVNNVHPAFYLPRIKQQFDKSVEFGLRQANNDPIEGVSVSIINAEGGTTKAGEKGAGGSPIGFYLDEFGKFACIAFLESARPAFMMDGRYKFVGILAGCLTENNKIYTHTGEYISIKDLTPEQGIIGFSRCAGKINKEPITYWQPPMDKECVLITTAKGHKVECSLDHPILYRSQTETYNYTLTKGIYKREALTYFKEAGELQKGDHVMLAREIPLWGSKEMWEPRMVGLLIGDGHYGIDSTPVLSNCDPDVYEYTMESFDAAVERTKEQKDGKTFTETRIKGICPELRKLGIYGQTCKDKRLPTDLHEYTEESICEMLGGIFDADGYASNTGTCPMIGIQLAVEPLIDEIQRQLNKLGIHPSKNVKKGRGKIRSIANGKPRMDNTTMYSLSIADKSSYLRFKEKISFMIKYKQERVNQGLKFYENKRSTQCNEAEGWVTDRVVSTIRVGRKPVYNLTAGETNTYLAGSVITHNTGGTDVLSQDALQILRSPEVYDIKCMDWDRLDAIADPDYITWERGKFGIFIPAQMSGANKKIETTLGEFVGDIPETSELYDLPFLKTNWKEGTRVIKEKHDQAKGDPVAYHKAKAAFPLSSDDCGSAGVGNPFPVSVIKKHKAKLISEGYVSRKVQLFENELGTFSLVDSHEKISDWPYRPQEGKGALNRCPIQVFEEFPEQTPQYGEFCAGFDGYKTNETVVTNQPSQGALYVLKRPISIGAKIPIPIIAASFVARMPLSKHNAACLDMIKAWNAMTLMESIDISLLQFMDEKNLANRYLQGALDFSRTVDPKKPAKTGGGKFGYTTGDRNKKFMHDYMVDLMSTKYEYLDEKGERKFIWGVETINDIPLLDEMMGWEASEAKPWNGSPGNYDRIEAYRAALAQHHHMSTSGVIVKTPEQLDYESRNTQRGDYERTRKNQANPFHTRRPSAASTKRRRKRRSL